MLVYFVQRKQEVIFTPVSEVEEKQINPTHLVKVKVEEMIYDEEEIKKSIFTPVVEKGEPVKAVETATPSNKGLTSISLKDHIEEDIKTASKYIS